MGYKLFDQDERRTIGRVVIKLFPENGPAWKIPCPICHNFSPDKQLYCTRSKDHTGIHVGGAGCYALGIWGEPSKEDVESIEREIRLRESTVEPLHGD